MERRQHVAHRTRRNRVLLYRRGPSVWLRVLLNSARPPTDDVGMKYDILIWNRARTDHRVLVAEDRPAAEHLLDLLRRHGCRHVLALPERPRGPAGPRRSGAPVFELSTSQN